MCRTAILNIFNIKKAFLEKAQKADKKGFCSPSPIKSGKSNGSRSQVIPPDALDDIRHHIQQFPAESSHYSRKKNPHRKYLSSDLSISKMYDLYKSEVAEPKREHVYRKVFNTEFNLGFGSPRSDTCATCDQMDANADVQNYEQHQRDAKQGYELMANDREEALSSPGINYMTFDLEKCLPLPRLTTGVVYYKRQLNIYNMIIHLCNTDVNNGFMHIWPETVAGRGSSEVGSCLGLLRLVSSGCRNFECLV